MALAQGFIHDDRSGDGDVEGCDLSGHRNTEEVVAGLFDKIVETRTLATEDEDGVGGEVVVGVAGGTTLVETYHPDVGLLHLFEGSDEVGYAGDADVFGGSGGGFGDGTGDGGGAAFGEQNAVDSGAVCGAEEGAQVVRVFDAVESEKEAGVAWEGDEIFDSEELAFADKGENTLVGVGFGETGELVAGLEGDANVVETSQVDEVLEFRVAAVPSHGDVVEAAATGADGLFDGMEAIENFHTFSLRGKKLEKGGVAL